MICSKCKKNEATVHYERYINDKSLKMDLCGSCAKAMGIGFSSPHIKWGGEFFGPTIEFPTMPPLVSQLFSALSQLPQSHVSEIAPSACPKCRWNLDKFQATGKMGCPSCYDHFRKETNTILTEIHGTATYTGTKIPALPQTPKPKTRPAKESKAQLIKQLEKAVKEERYEDAAKLRDLIRALENNRK